jgi:hypothetical protein
MFLAMVDNYLQSSTIFFAKVDIYSHSQITTVFRGIYKRLGTLADRSMTKAAVIKFDRI